MAFIKRNAAGTITAVSDDGGEGFSEELAADDTELGQFLNGLQLEADDLRGTLNSTDQGLIRVLEDLIEVLTEKGLISLQDFPTDARDKLLLRQQLRRQVRAEPGQD